MLSYNAMRPKRSFVVLSKPSRSGYFFVDHEDLLLENVQCKRMHWTKNVNVLQVRFLFRKCGNEINALNLN